MRSNSQAILGIAVDLEGFEPSYFGLQDRCSSCSATGPLLRLHRAPAEGFEPPTFSLTGSCPTVWATPEWVPSGGFKPPSSSSKPEMLFVALRRPGTGSRNRTSIVVGTPVLRTGRPPGPDPVGGSSTGTRTRFWRLRASRHTHRPSSQVPVVELRSNS